MMENLINSFKDLWLIVTGSGGMLGIIALIAFKFISNDKLFDVGDKIGTFATLGMSKFKGYQRFEDWFINGFDVFWQGIMHGLRSDNSPENDTIRTAKKA